MLHATPEDFLELVELAVQKSKDICVAIDKQLTYIALNDVACTYLKIKPETLIGKTAIQVYPEIIASRNHRNILRAISGIQIVDDLVESRMGDILKCTYTPVTADKEVVAVILNATIHLPTIT